MDIATHALASLALMRGFFPRRSWTVAAGMVVAGTLADVDGLSALGGPEAYLTWHGTLAHSFLAALVIVAIATILTMRWNGKKAEPAVGIVVAIGVATIAHLVLDWCGSDGVVLMWPVRRTRFAGDLLPNVDAWILLLLIVGIVMPELFRLVGSEIGAKDKGPRGRHGALVALGLLVIYVAARGVLHANALVELDAHAYKGESPRRVGAFADALSIFNWHGIVETQSSICLVEAEVGPGHVFDAESAACQHKPDASPELDVAQKTAAAVKFLRVARFPKATVVKTEDGYEVEMRALEDSAEDASWHRVAARVVMDAQRKMVSEELLWSKDLGRRWEQR